MNPPTSHGEDADQQAYIPASKHYLLALSASSTFLGLSWRPDAHAYDEQVEEDDGHQAWHVDAHGRSRHTSVTHSLQLIDNWFTLNLHLYLTLICTK